MHKSSGLDGFFVSVTFMTPEEAKTPTSAQGITKIFFPINE